MKSHPPRCPNFRCPARQPGSHPHVVRKGSYKRRCDGRRVPRFLCRACARGFSSQTFRLDYRLRKPWLDWRVVDALCAKVTLRKTAELLGVDRKTVERRLDRFGVHCRAFHRWMLDAHRTRNGGLRGSMMLDELETFERDRRLCPVTVPVLIEKRSFFVVHVETGTLPARGGLRGPDQIRRKKREALHGQRRNGSREAVRRTFVSWKRVASQEGCRQLQSDRKRSYPSVLREVFGADRPAHAQHSSRLPRTPRNPLFPINLTNAMLRDSLSRLVRRTWAASKERWRLRRHLWIFVVWRNYVRGRTRADWLETPAMKLGVTKRKLAWREILKWSAPFLSRHRAH